MTPEQFCYWLQGYVEVASAGPPTAREWVIIRSHLNLVFEKKTSAYPQDRLEYMTTYPGLTYPPVITC